MKKLLKFSGLALTLLSVLISCEDNTPVVIDEVVALNGAIILNEGNYGASNASISFVDLNYNVLYNNVFEQVNGRTPGDVLQSATIVDSTLYLVLNVSGKIEVCHATRFTEQTSIESLMGPRYAVALDQKLYVSQWDSTGSVKVFDLVTNQEEARIEVGSGPEGVLAVNGQIWVANGGGYGVDSTISVIDPVSNTVVETIEVGHNPKELVQDANGNVWVVCAGYTAYDANWSVIAQTPSRLVEVSTDYQILNNLEFSQNGATHIDVNKGQDSIYVGAGFGFDAIHKVSVANPEILESFVSGSFYGFNVNPANGDLYTFDAGTFSDQGVMEIRNSSGVVYLSGLVGIGPNSALFVKE